MPDDIAVSMVSRATETATTTVGFHKIIEGIRTGQWEPQVKAIREAFGIGDRLRVDILKKALPAVTFSGVFTQRSAKGLSSHSGLICVDLDDLGERIPAVRDRLEADPHVLALFLSPTGSGLKVVCRIDPSQEHLESYYAAEAYFAKEHKLEIDRACKDVARLCFVSFDPDAYLAATAAALPYPPRTRLDEPFDASKHSATRSMQESEVRRLLQRIRPRPPYADWFRIISAVASILSPDAAERVLKDWSPEERRGEYAEKLRNPGKEIYIGTLVRYAQLGWETQKGQEPLPEKAKDMTQTDPVNNQTERERLEGMLAERAFNFDCPPKKPTPRFFINNTPVSTPGNLTTILAQAKAGKSSVVQAMIAAVLVADNGSLGRDTLGILASEPKGKILIHIDTEQGEWRHYQIVKQAHRRAGADKSPYLLWSFALTGMSPEDRRSSLKLLLELARDDGVYSVIIDGVSDFVYDVNDAAESIELVSELHALAGEYDCPIICVIHENPGHESGKARGHLGSELERKAESNLRLRKKNEITTIFSHKMREAPILEEDGPRFLWNKDVGMHISAVSLGLAKNEAKREQQRAFALEVFARLNKKEARHKDLIKAISEVAKITASTAEDRLKAMRKLDLIVKNPATELWALASPVAPSSPRTNPVTGLETP